MTPSVALEDRASPAPAAQDWPMKLFLCPVSQKSLYIKLMLHDLGGGFAPIFREQGGLAEAIACLDAGEHVLVHVQWEEFFFSKFSDAQEAETVAIQVADQLRRIVALGGRILWTIHNALPHEIPHVAQFMTIRRLLADLSSRILVHNLASRDFLVQQLAMPALGDKTIVLPHPSYAGLYEAEGSAEAAVREGAFGAGQKFVLGFGTMRKQKGFHEMLKALGPTFTETHQFRLRISGQGREGALLRARFADRTDIDWDLNYVPMEDVPALMRAASCLVLPYQRLLTSGIALLALTLGGIIVAPAVPTFMELLPAPLRRFLYDPDDPRGLRRAVTKAIRLTPDESRACRLQALAVADTLHPALISAQLAHIYRMTSEMTDFCPPIAAGAAR